MLDLRPEIEEHWDGYRVAFERVMTSGRFILGPEVDAFEQELARYLGVKHAIGVNSGTDALVISLRALGIGPGDEVITTPFTFFATAEAVASVGATPVFVDIDPRTFNIDPELIEAAVTERTRAILPVHLFGQPCQMDRILEVAARYGLKVVEDCAQALGGAFMGKKVGTFGAAAALSFFPSKNLGGFGDGGMVVTDDDEVAEGARCLRVHGSVRKYQHEAFGYNSRLDELQAALIRVRLPGLDEANEHRGRVAVAYDDALSSLPNISIPYRVPEARHVFHQYTVRVPSSLRQGLIDLLRKSGVQCAVHYPSLASDAKPFTSSVELDACATARAATLEVLSLPLPTSPAAISIVVDALAVGLGRAR